MIAMYLSNVIAINAIEEPKIGANIKIRVKDMAKQSDISATGFTRKKVNKDMPSTPTAKSSNDWRKIIKLARLTAQLR